MIRRILVLAVPAAALLVAPAGGANLPVRTFAMSVGVDGGPADGASTRPALSARGNTVAFDSVATNLAPDGNGPIRDVFVRDVSARSTQLVSKGPNREAANGPSSHAAIGGDVVVFQSDASNLVPGDANGKRDVFARDPDGSLVRVSIGRDGAEPNGDSSDADISADGSQVVFVSTASNLVTGDTNGTADVFVRDLRTGQTRIVARDANGPSGAPAISPDGGYVSFASKATNLVRGDTNRIQDVFLADLERPRITRESVNVRGQQQNRAVIAPFWQVSDVGRNGRFMVFDSDATNLVLADRNRDTDVFARDTRRNVTRRVSLDKFGFEGDNDSFNPSISPDGAFVAFQSFAARLAAGDGPKEDVFLYDFNVFAPTTISVGARGQQRGRERGGQVLQRPRVSADGLVVAFTSTASNLVGSDPNGVEDVFLRRTAPPRVRVRGLSRIERTSRPRLELSADDPRVREFLCELDGVRIRCGRSTRLPRIGRGRHVLRVRAGGPGMLFQKRPVVRRFRVAR